MRLAPFIVLALLAATCPAADLHVPAQHPTIQAAIVAAAPGDTVLVAPGTYNEALNTLGKAITLASTGGPAVTTLDGTGLNTSILTMSSGGPGTVISGFTFANGVGTGTTSRQGGAVLLTNASPTITGCVFENNTAVWGGAILCQAGASPAVSDTLFRNNTANAPNGGGGGAIFVGGPDAAPSFERCTFEGNLGRQGGAAYINNSATTFADCDFIANTAAVVGGAIQCGANQNIPGPRPRFDRCRFLRNHAGDGSGFLGNGGAIETFYRGGEFNDCLFAGNTADGFGPHVAHLLGSESDFTNCTFYGYDGTTQPILTSQSDMRMVNCIVWDPALPSTALGTTITVSQSIVRGGFAGTNNSGADPLFADPLGPDGILGTLDDDYTLLPGSPAIDSGDNTARPAMADLDLAGNPRLADDPLTPDTGIGDAPIVDRGALEVQGPPPCPCDSDANGMLNLDDIDAFLIGFIAQTGVGDCNADGAWTLDDIDCFAACFLAGCP